MEGYLAMETIFKRRSVRKYTETPVTDAQVKQIIRAGMAAPSAKNSQNGYLLFCATGNL